RLFPPRRRARRGHRRRRHRPSSRPQRDLHADRRARRAVRAHDRHVPDDVPHRIHGPRRKVIGRRALLTGAAAATSLSASVPFAGRAWADADPDWRPRDLDVREVRVPGTLSQLFVLATPRHLESYERVPLVVLLHGLGETGDARMGAWAWLERYGLGTSYDRLRGAGSMRGLVVACPYMPDLPVADPRAFDEYARWLVETVVPRARREAPAAFDNPALTHLGGCSLGG